MPRTAPSEPDTRGARSAIADAPTQPATGGGRRRWWRPLLWTIVGAAVALSAYLAVDRAGTSDPERAAPGSSTPTTTLAPPVAATVYRAIQPSLVLIRTSDGNGNRSLGSGVIINRQGQIMTADHVIAGATTIQVTFADGTSSVADVVSSTPERDTAILEAQQPPRVIVPAVLGGGVKVGDEAFSVGNPLGLADSMTAGVVSGVDRSIEREDGAGELEGLIQFDAAVNPGSSGGPLLNRRGQVVGIVTALANPSGQRFFVGIGFAVPIATTGGGGSVPPS